jgi:redox-sensitive bicupin YhaK (pirin superfamily)
MIQVRRGADRGHFDHGWLNTYHTFSFADYYDPKHMGFRDLRVINEDRVRPGYGFPTHGHRDMEIISYVLEGALEHRDSIGTGSVIRPGDVQRMSAGTGVTHSEFNPSKEEGVHFLQIWILPERRAITPSYEQQTFTEAEKAGRLRVVASPDGRDGSVRIHQDVTVFASVLRDGERLSYELAPNRAAWVQVARGAVRLNGNLLEQGDGASATAEGSLEIVGDGEAEILLFDLR